MASDIFNIPAWNYSTVYKLNDIVTNNGYFYYATTIHTSDAIDFNTDLNNGKWNGTTIYQNEKKPFFFWKPSYRYTIQNQPRIKTVKFGDGYSQDLKDGINNNLMIIDLSFDERDLQEHKAIIHFLHQRAGYEKFVFIPPQPYGVTKRFICKEWTPSQTFVDNYNITAKFEERAL